MDDFNETTTIISLFIQALIGLGAVTFAFLQWRINRRLKQLQDFVSISVHYEDKLTCLTVLNVGKSNLYVYKYEFAGKTESMERGELIPLDVAVEATYRIIIPIEELIMHTVYTLKLYVSDGGKKKYISEHDVIKSSFDVTRFKIETKSYTPIKTNWKF